MPLHGLAADRASGFLLEARGHLLVRHRDILGKETLEAWSVLVGERGRAAAAVWPRLDGAGGALKST